MGLFSTMLGRGGGVAATSNDPIVVGNSPDDDFWYNPLGGGPSASGQRVTTDGAMQVSAVYACVSVLSKMAGMLPLRMYQKGTGKDAGKLFEAPNHPLNELLEYQPNRWQTAFDFKSFMMASVALRGNAYAEIISGPRGFVDSLEPRHPDLVRPERLDDGAIRYVITEKGKVRAVPQRQMFHIRSHCAPGGLVGIGPIAFARETVGLALAAEEHGARTFSNGARPQGFIKIPPGMGEETGKKWIAEWNAQNSGRFNSGRTPIMEEGGEFVPITMTNDETQFMELRKHQIEEIARWFDVPLVMLHHLTGQSTWGTGVEAIMLAFVRNNLRPWLRNWTDAIRRDLILAPNSYEAVWDTEELTRGDTRAVADLLGRLVTIGVLTRNEGRAMLDRNPLPGLDEPLIMINTAELSKAPDHSADASASNAGSAP